MTFSDGLIGGITYPVTDDDGNDPTERSLRPYRPATHKRLVMPGGTYVFNVTVGDATCPVQPGDVTRFEVFPQRVFQLHKLLLTQYPVGATHGGAPCRWPVECCYVGDRCVDGMALYDAAAEPITCQLGQRIELRIRNPLAVPAAVFGVLVGRTYRASATMRCSVDHVDDLRPCPRCGDLRCPRCRDARGYCKFCDSTNDVVCAPEHHRGELSAYPRGAPDRHRAAPPCEVCGGAVGPDFVERDFIHVLCATCHDLKGKLHPQTPAKPGGPVWQTAADLLRALGNPPGLEGVVGAPAKRGVPTPTPVIYCEAAPPRGVVEAATCLLDGDEVGAPALRPRVRVPLVFTARMKIEWERHRDHEDRWGRQAAVAAAQASPDARAVMWLHGQRAAVIDHDITPPSTRDAYGGLVMCDVGDAPHPVLARHGYRCRLCGAWLRTVAL